MQIHVECKKQSMIYTSTVDSPSVPYRDHFSTITELSSHADVFQYLNLSIHVYLISYSLL